MLELTKDNFKSEISESNQTAFVDFWAPWCGPCKMIAPIFEALSNDYENAVFGKVNVDDQPDLAQEFSVMSIPTILAIKDGTVVDQKVGFTTEQDLRAFVEKYI